MKQEDTQARHDACVGAVLKFAEALQVILQEATAAGVRASDDVGCLHLTWDGDTGGEICINRRPGATPEFELRFRTNAKGSMTVLAANPIQIRDAAREFFKTVR